MRLNIPHNHALIQDQDEKRYGVPLHWDLDPWGMLVKAVALNVSRRGTFIKDGFA